MPNDVSHQRDAIYIGGCCLQGIADVFLREIIWAADVPEFRGLTRNDRAVF